MVKSPSSSSPQSCLKIIACGSDSAVEEDDNESHEAKGSNDKQGWSFRKRSSRRQVLSDRLISRNQTPAGNCAASEKVVALEQQNEKSQREKQSEKSLLQLLQGEPKSPPLESNMPETVGAPQSPTVIKPELHDAVDAQAELPRLLESETVAEPSDKPLSAVELEVYETVVKPELHESVDAQAELQRSVESGASETVVNPSAEPLALVEPEVYEAEVKLKPELHEDVDAQAESLTSVDSGAFGTEVEPSTEPLASVEPEVYEAVVKPEVHESVDAQAESPRSVESGAFGTVVEPSAKPLASAEPEVHETVVARTTEPAEQQMTETVLASQENDDNVIVEESSAVVIQSAMRGFLARRDFLQLACIVKLQAAIRGHLVRRHAVDSLYCLQCIVKAQSLVCDCQLKFLDEEASVNKPLKTHTPVEKLLRSSFARQLLNSAPKARSTTVNCDSTRPSSPWTWLERWMTVCSYDLLELQKSESRVEVAQIPAEKASSLNEAGNLFGIITKSLDSEISSTDSPSSVMRLESSFKDESSSFLNSEPSFKDAPNLFLNSEPRFNDSNGLILESESSVEDASGSLEDGKNSASYIPEAENIGSSDLFSTGLKLKNPTYHHNKKSDPSSVESLKKVDIELAEELESSEQKFASTSVQLSAENKQFAYESGKLSSPSFIAPLSKYEKLRSSENAGGSFSLPRVVDNDINCDVDADTSLSAIVSTPKIKDLRDTEVSTSDDSRVQIGGSKCGSELSITSTLDSSGLYEAGTEPADPELKFPRETASDVISKEESLELEAKGNSSTFIASDLSSSILVQQKVEVCDTEYGSASGVTSTGSPLQMMESKEVTGNELVNNKHTDPIPVSDSSPPQMEKEKPEIDSSEKNQLYANGSHAELLSCNEYSSPMASFNGHANVESQEITSRSSEVSEHAKRNKTVKCGSQSYPRSSAISGDKRSSHNPSHDSSVRCSSFDHPSLKVQKSGEKRRNSFGSAKLDNNLDQEPRNSTGSIKTLPKYMQATESARAKVHSPRSSPDVQEIKDLYAKKRHSFPSVSGRQGSPHVQRPPSQAPKQFTKANGNAPTCQERKWVR